MITGIISRNNFTFKSFYQRRILRIIPPLLAVLLAAIVLGWMILTPDEYERMGAHLRSSSFFCANFYLLGEEGYFDITGAQKPLLHLWSLAVEEQFYIFYPLILIISAKYFREIFGVLILISISLIYMAFMDNQTIKFYSPLSRAFELGCGAFSFMVPTNKKYAFLTSFIGLIFIIIAVAQAANHHAWPNGWTFILCSGTALVLWGGAENWILRTVLANKFIVFIGLISYELYLWHWLFLSMGFIVTGVNLSNLAKTSLLISSFIISILCFLLFEKPIRVKYRDNNKVGVALLIGLILLGGIGQIVNIKNGFPSRIGETYLDRTPYVQRGAKFFPDWKNWTDMPNHVLLEDDPDKIDIAIIGDSHAGQLFPGLIEQLKGSKKIGIFPASGQAPWPGIATFTDSLKNYRRNGYKLISQAYETVLNNKNIKTVIFAHNPDCSYIETVDPLNLNDNDKTSLMRNAILKGLTLLKNAGKNVIIVLDNPHLEFDPSSIKKRPFAIFNLDGSGKFSNIKNLPLQWYENICRDIATNFDNVHIVDLYDVFCNNNGCLTIINGKNVYLDRNHLNYTGSNMAVSHILKEVPEFFN